MFKKKSNIVLKRKSTKHAKISHVIFYSKLFITISSPVKKETGLSLALSNT